ncbi:Cell wall-associated polypeptide CWBP200 [Prevotella disiens]|nr:Cell wall-associated polypeptide CWBP200 [Prevotella disiens]
MIVSGRNVYDAFGRVTKAYYPTTEAVGKKTTFNKAFDNVSPTVTVYDVLDRAMKVTLPDNAETKTEYSTDAGSNALVTTVTDALGNRQATYTDGSGKTVKTEQLSGPDGTITTSFEYDGIDRLVKVTDTEGNVTTSVYDMGDRRTEVNHPASGITTFTYDALGNVLTKQTANLKKEGKTINYEYDYGRLTAINYPDHPENNVKYHYGGINSSYNRIGRLMLREDGSGAIEYYYGKMGEVLKTVRTLIVPNQAVATYVTQWKYDSHNRLLEMIYPDEEKVTYGYNLGGQVDHVRGYKSYGYDYVNKIGYDKFEQRTYLKYCNGAETFYSYDPARRRLQNLVVNAKAGTIMDNAYSYDAVSNVLGIKNNAPLPQSGKAGGQMSHSYTYDPLYRLASATGTYKGTDNKSASYTLSMGYDNMHRITSKKQHLTQNNVQFDGTLNAGYELTYTYQKADGKKFQLDNVRDINYRTEETPTDSTNINNGHKYTYDANGNLVYINTSRVKKDNKEDDKASEQKYKWDEENRLLAADENGFVSNYWYDADGERTVKTSGENEAIYVNSEFSGGNTGTARFSLYVSPYLVAGQGGKYTKHIYIGSQRIVSKLGDLASYGADPRRIPYAGNEADGLTINYKDKYNQQLQSIKDNYKTFDLPYNGKDNDDYVNGQGFCCNDGTPEAAQARTMARTRAVNGNFKPNDDYEKMQFFYHPDHLGSSNYITNLDGEVSQHIEYVPFGEVFIEERNNTWNTPYLFNAKEFDEETGLYYYGARYYEPRLSLWMSTDMLSELFPQVTAYCYTDNNPIKYKDPDGNRKWPVNTTYKGASRHIDSWYGPRNISYGSKFHRGLDINFGTQDFDYGAPVLATHDGVVQAINSSPKGGGGRFIIINSPDGSFQTGYLHLKSINVEVGQKISEGDVIGEIGGSGKGKERGYVPHLHYQIKKLNQKTRKYEHFDPTQGKGKKIENIVDPQLWINKKSSDVDINMSSPIQLPEVIVIGNAPQKNDIVFPPIINIPKEINLPNSTQQEQ